MITVKSILNILIFKLFLRPDENNIPFHCRCRGTIILNKFIIIAAVIILSSVSCSKKLEMKYSVLDENIIDTAAKNQVTLKLKVSGEISSNNCREVLNRLYIEYKKKEVFKYSKTPGSLFIYLYDSTESAEDSGQWIGMLNWNSSSVKPQINIKEEIISELEKGAARKFGLSLKKRKQIFADTVLARDRATAEAERKYHALNLNTKVKEKPTYGQVMTAKKARIYLVILEKQAAYIRSTVPIYIKEVIKKHNINSRIMTEIAIEGYKKKWPMPVLDDIGIPEN
ncbi:MAG: hypothetical protein MUC95_03680 [Spirochaetes bacterium]|nr:hypothetical protein [Spirochaetota bacterium]